MVFSVLATLVLAFSSSRSAYKNKPSFNKGYRIFMIDNVKKMVLLLFPYLLSSIYLIWYIRTSVDHDGSPKIRWRCDRGTHKKWYSCARP